MRKRKVSFKKPEKTDNTNRKVVLWSGQAAPFKIVPHNFNKYTEAEWLKMVEENQKNQRKSKKKKKRDKKASAP